METVTEDQTKSKYNNPLSLLKQLRDLVFGKEIPDPYTQTTFFLSISIWVLLFFWSVISYFVIVLRAFIYEQKEIDVEKIINERGEQLGFKENEFLDSLLTFHSISIICWILVLIALILLWRKNIKFIYFFFVGTLFYIGMILFYLNPLYFREDITFFDKIAFIALNANVLIYYFLLKKEKGGGSINFFDEEEI